VQKQAKSPHALVKVSRYLTQKPKLKGNFQTSQVVQVEELEYLGFTFRGFGSRKNPESVAKLNSKWDNSKWAGVGKLSGGPI
jgi:hypothetical protein